MQTISRVQCVFTIVPGEQEFHTIIQIIFFPLSTNKRNNSMFRHSRLRLCNNIQECLFRIMQIKTKIKIKSLQQTYHLRAK